MSLPPGSIIHTPGHVIDLMPTLIEVTGASYPRSLHGKDIIPFEGTSLVPIWNGRATDREKPLFWEFEGKHAMREGKWKLLGQEGGAWELYDLSLDRAEQENLAAMHPERVKAMAARHTEWKNHCGIPAWEEVSGDLINIPGLKR